MTPGARILAAIEISLEIENSRAPADGIIDAYFRVRRYAGSKDRRAVRERVYSLIRHRARLDWWIERASLSLTPAPRFRAIADLALSDKLTPADMDQIFSGTTHCPDVLDDIEQKLAHALAARPLSHHADMPSSVANEYPEWLDTTLRLQFGDRTEQEMAALNQPATVDVRVNIAKTSYDAVWHSLQSEGIAIEHPPYSPLAIRLPAGTRLGGTKVWKDGHIEIQDEGSQLLSLLCDAKPGMNVIDFCAGAGGKTLALAAMMSQSGKLNGNLSACDIFEQRLKRMIERLKRAGVHGVHRHVLSLSDDTWVTKNAGKADRVLLDVPCSGTGIWRRKPDSKWRLSHGELEEVLTAQQQILETASGLVKPGGRLIYATCSLLRDENEAQVEAFLDKNPMFSCIPYETIWDQAIGGPLPPHANGNYMRLSPASTQTDGFFCAIMEKTS